MDNKHFEPVLSKKAAFSYAAGEMASQFLWTFTSSYLTIFYTDIAGLSAAAIGMIFMIARIWDAVNDPMMGLLAERTKSRHGRFRPYIRYCTPFMAFFFVLTFTAPSFRGNNTVQIVWAMMTYMGLGMLFTAVNLPFGSLINVMTKKPDERNTLAAFRTFGMGLGAIGVSAIGIPLLLYFSGGKNYTQRGYLILTILIAVVVVPLFTGIVFPNCKEVITVSESRNISVKKSLKSCLNRPLLCVFGFVFFGLTAKFGFFAMISYYTIYIMRRADLTAVLFTFLNISSLCSVFIGVYIVKRFGKKITLFLSCFLCAFMHVALFLADWNDASSIIILIVLRGLAEFGQPCFMSTVPDCVDYAEKRTGIRADGTASAVQSFGAKLGSAAGGTIGVALLAWVGYAANEIQITQVMSDMNAVIHLFPAVGWLLALVPILMYPLGDEQKEKRL